MGTVSPLTCIVFLLSLGLRAKAYPEDFNQTDGRFHFYFYDDRNLLLTVHLHGCYHYDVQDDGAVESHLDNHRLSDTLLGLIEHSITYGINVTQLSKEAVAANYSYLVSDPACRSEAPGLFKDFFGFTLPALTPQATSAPVTTTAAPTTTTPAPEVPLFQTCVDDVVGQGATCATVPDICTDPYGQLVCRRFCRLCTDHASHPTSHPHVGTPGQCEDALVGELNCTEIPDICLDSKAALFCRKTCNDCAAPTSTTAAPTTTATAEPTTTTAAPAITTTAATTTTTTEPATTTSAPTTTKPSTTPATATTTTTVPTTTKPSTTPTTAATTAAPATTARATTPTTASALTTKPTTGNVRCVQCGDYDRRVKCQDMELYLDAITPCADVTATRCMTDLITDSSGEYSIFKRCSSDTPCQRLWYDQTSDKPVCLNFDPAGSSPDLSCHFCCVGNGCNINVVPEYNTQWRP